MQVVYLKLKLSRILAYPSSIFTTNKKFRHIEIIVYTLFIFLEVGLLFETLFPSIWLGNSIVLLTKMPRLYDTLTDTQVDGHTRRHSDIHVDIVT